MLSGAPQTFSAARNQRATTLSTRSTAGLPTGSPISGAGGAQSSDIPKT